MIKIQDYCRDSETYRKTIEHEGELLPCPLCGKDTYITILLDGLGGYHAFITCFGGGTDVAHATVKYKAPESREYVLQHVIEDWNAGRIYYNTDADSCYSCSRYKRTPGKKRGRCLAGVKTKQYKICSEYCRMNKEEMKAVLTR